MGKRQLKSDFIAYIFLAIIIIGVLKILFTFHHVYNFTVSLRLTLDNTRIFTALHTFSFFYRNARAQY